MQHSLNKELPLKIIKAAKRRELGDFSILLPSTQHSISPEGYQLRVIELSMMIRCDVPQLSNAVWCNLEVPEEAE
jgi:hypothetical protein